MCNLGCLTRVVVFVTFVVSCHSKFNITSRLVSELWHGDSPFNYANLSYFDILTTNTSNNNDYGYPHTIQFEVIDAVLAHTNSTFLVVAGTLLEGSTIRIAERIKYKHYDTSIVSIDPFTGNAGMLLWENSNYDNNIWRMVRNEYGRPRMYDRFLANIRELGHDDLVVPVCASAIVGLRYIGLMVEFEKLDTLPQVIYIDSAHETDETLLELTVAWQTLKPQGIIFGDWGWRSVQTDVLKFAQQIVNFTDVTKLATIKNQLSGAVFENNVLRVNGQWIIAKL